MPSDATLLRMTTNVEPQICPTCHQVLTARGVVVPGAKESVTVHARNEAHLVAAFRTAQDAATDRVTGFAGSLSFVYLHAAWFVVWILLNAGLAGAGLIFDAFPYGLLTMVVSLEAIFLSTFVMVSQNRQAARADLRSELDFETNLRSEIWSIHIGRQLGLDPTEIEQHVQRAVQANKAQIAGSAGVDAQPAFDPEAA